MATTRLSTKGKIVMPKDICNSHSWGPGTEFAVEEVPEGILLRSAKSLPASKLEDVVGSLPVKGKAMTIAQMDQASAREVIRRHKLGRY